MLAGHAREIVLVAVMLLGLGVGQAIASRRSPGLVGELGRDSARGVSESSVYGIFRLIERTGNALGPLVAAPSGPLWFHTTVMIIGGAMAILALSFGALIGLMRQTKLELPAAKG